MKYDVVLVCAGDDLSILDVVVAQIKKTLDYKAIYCITNADGMARIKNDSVTVVDETKVRSGLSLKDIRDRPIAGFPSRASWYYQQFLKMEFARYRKSDDPYLIWDADTIPLRPMSFELGGKPLFTRGEERLNHHYARNFESITGLRFGFAESMISQHMLIDPKAMISLIELVERKWDRPFSLAVLDNLSGDSISLFSEYEFYANYCLAVGIDFAVSGRSWFRNGRSLMSGTITENKLSRLARYYDYVAFEKFDAPTGMRKLKSRIMHAVNVLRHLLQSSHAKSDR
jgi:hypothetical protein